MKKKIIMLAVAVFAAASLCACGSAGAIISPTPAGEETPSKTPTKEPEKPTEVPTEVPTEAPTETPTPTPKPAKDLSEFNPADFFADAVYCGDSCMNFYMWRGNSYVHPDIFGKFNANNWYAVNSYCVRLAVKNTSELTEAEAAMVPKFGGDPCNLWDVIPALGKHRVFLFFGLNDIGVTGVDGFLDNYKTLIDKIKATGFDTKIYILSITSMRKDKQSTTGGLTNAKIKEANEKLVKMCEENGWTFVDVASKLRDENYDLLLEYSDGTNVHITKEGYVFWDEAMEKLAREELRKEYYEDTTK